VNEAFPAAEAGRPATRFVVDEIGQVERACDDGDGIEGSDRIRAEDEEGLVVQEPMVAVDAGRGTTFKEVGIGSPVRP
jgi:hypothetical protein